MSTFLTDISPNLEYEAVTMSSTGGGVAGSGSCGANTTITTQTQSGAYEYHLPHTKTIDLIGEEFVPRNKNPSGTPNVVVVSAVPIRYFFDIDQAWLSTAFVISLSTSFLGSGGSVFTATSSGVGPLIQALPNTVVTHSASSAGTSTGSAPAPSLQSSASSGLQTVSVVTASGEQTHLQVPIDQQQQQQLNLSTVTVDMPTIAATGEENNGGVLLCNLDELSRYHGH